MDSINRIAKGNMNISNMLIKRADCTDSHVTAFLSFVVRRRVGVAYVSLDEAGAGGDPVA